MTEFLETLRQVGQTIQEASLYDAKEWKSPTSARKRNPHKATIATLAGIHLFNQFVRRNSSDFTVCIEPSTEGSGAHSNIYSGNLGIGRAQGKPSFSI
jgi:hypothetical protein